MKPSFPQQPTIVFAGANNSRRVDVLRDCEVDAVMTSFEYIGKGHYMKKVWPKLQEWNVRTYLDSGVFTFVRKAGTTRIRIARAGQAELPPASQQLDEFFKYREEYEAYLKEHYKAWDHIIELDIDEVAATIWYEAVEPKPTEHDLLEGWAERGREWALELIAQQQASLRRIVGDRLMPAWHVQRGHEGWTEMIKKFPYVAIGSDTGVPTSTTSTRPPMQTKILRGMVREAHEQGTGVHYLGDTRYRTFLETELDSADSTTWVSAGRFGQFPGPKGQSLRYTTKGGLSWQEENEDEAPQVVELVPHDGAGLARQKLDWQRTIRPIDMSRARQFEDLMSSWGIDPDKILAGSQEERLQSNIKLLIMRQAEIRRVRKSEGPTAPLPS